MKVLESFNVKYGRIPPRACTWQALEIPQKAGDVEVFHKIVEDELYDIEDYKDYEEFKTKAYAYGLYFNFKRKNRYRGQKTPIDILKETGSNISPYVFNLPSLILDNFIDEFIKGVAYHVGSSGDFSQKKKLDKKDFYYILSKSRGRAAW